jgi:hypothetical protein
MDVTCHSAMNKIFPILLIFTLLSCKNAQVNSTDDRLYQHVDSLITQVLNYEYNEDTFVRPIVIDTTLKRPIHSSHSTLPKNPEPPILLNGEIVKKEELRNYSIEKMRTIEAIKPSDTTTALFGTLGKNGLIIIHSKKIKIEPWN